MQQIETTTLPQDPPCCKSVHKREKHFEDEKGENSVIP